MGNSKNDAPFLQVEGYSIYPLWTGKDAIDYRNPESLLNRDQITIYTAVDQLRDYDFGHNVFLHGMAVTHYRDALVISYSTNPNGENMQGEQYHVKWSYDGGKTWGNEHSFFSHIPDHVTTHGALLVEEDTLYAVLEAQTFKTHKQMELWRYLPEQNDWEYFSCIDNFSCSSPVYKMEDGNFILAGSGIKGAAAVAITENGDLTKWKLVFLPHSVDCLWEVGLVIQGSTVECLVRPKTNLVPDPFGQVEKRPAIMACVSHDYGKTFTDVELSNIFCSRSKICGGVLSDGRPYAIFNMVIDDPLNLYPARLRFLLAVGEKGGISFTHMYTLLEAKHAVSYPYSVEKDGVLYIAYSEMLDQKDLTFWPDKMNNCNNGMLMTLPLTCIPQ